MSDFSQPDGAFLMRPWEISGYRKRKRLPLNWKGFSSHAPAVYRHTKKEQ